MILIYKNNSTVHMLCVWFCVSGGNIQLLFLQIEQIIGQTPQRLIKLLVRADIILHKYHPGICKRNKTGIEWTLLDSFRFHLRAWVRLRASAFMIATGLDTSCSPYIHCPITVPSFSSPAVRCDREHTAPLCRLPIISHPTLRPSLSLDAAQTVSVN